MKSFFKFKTAPKEVVKLVGAWQWTANKDTYWHLDIRSTNFEIESDESFWAIEESRGQLLAYFRAEHMCRWLGLEQLLALSPVVAKKAVNIALLEHEILEILGVINRREIKIENIFELHSKSNYMAINLNLVNDAQKDNPTKSLELSILAEVLMEHVRTNRIEPNTFRFNQKSDSNTQIEDYVCVELGFVRLKIEQLNELRCGSLLMIEGAYVNQAILCIKVDEFEIDIIDCNEPGKWTVLGIRRKLEGNMQKNVDLLESHSLESNAMNIGDILMNVTVRLSQAKIRLAELTQMQPGSLISLNISHDVTMDIVCGEVTIAQGCLVEVDGRLAVEVLMMRQSK